MEPNYSYIFKDSNELGKAIWKYHDECVKNAHEYCQSHKHGNDYIIKHYGDPEKWNTSNVTDMMCLFYEIYEPIDFSMYDISNWDTSNVISMKNMFKEGWIWYDISKWNVDKVEDMSYMFYEGEFNIKLDLSKWNIENVKYP